jgi:glycosyltransferase involved in cell wall biosynthesis
VLVAGMVAGDPRQGGATWAVLQYLRGLERLGHEVLVVEPVSELREDVIAYFRSLELGRAALLLEATHDTVGLEYDAIAAFDAELLLNISGLLRDREIRDPVPTRLFLDLDPVFAQIWHAQGVDVGLDGHTHFATVGQGLAGSRAPLDRHWIPTLPPVVLDEWRFAERVVHDAFTTVGNWRSYGSVEWRGARYGQKAHAVRRLIDLPRLTRERLLPALAIHPAEQDDLRALAAHGWELLDPERIAATPDSYRGFLSGSKGEIGLAKAGYVDSGCGWFSDRSACYLAAGRPVVAHDTGFGRFLPTGEGLLAFRTAREAAGALERVSSDYARQRQAARAVAEAHLDSDLVLTRLLEAVL